MAKSKIYTRTGDKGLTSLVGGKRVPKTDPRLHAYGTIDELNSFIGLLVEEIEDEHDKNVLKCIQNMLFNIGAYLATEPVKRKEFKIIIDPEGVAMLESEIDQIDETLPALNYFVLPGGCKSAALAHICRTICRRAEREIYGIDQTEDQSTLLLNYVNRLSDYFFVLARKCSFRTNGEENIWKNYWK